jgi:cell division protein FtsI (penicillin-binding protein 3)
LGALDRRIGILFLAFIALLVIGVLRATYLGSVQAGSLRRAAATQQAVTSVVPAPRGTITDRNGVELAVSEAADEVDADPYLIKHPQAVAELVAPLLGQSFATVLTKLTKPGTGFSPLAHFLPASRALAIAHLRINGMPIDGITLTPETRRTYPAGDEAAQVLGFVGGQGQGLWGLEGYYNKALIGQSGLRRTVSDAVGQPIAVDQLRPMVPGKTLRLTIDSALQEEVEQVLAGVGTQYSPKGATAIVANPQTGAILALANWPSFNANNPFASPQSSWEDQAVGFSYEPGSTFKAITVAGALQDRLITPNTTFDIPPELQVADRTIHDAEDHGYETLSVANILKFSSNIGADEIGMRLGAKRFDNWVHRFGFGSPTGVDLPGEQQGIVLHYWQYSGSSMGNLPFGQGESVTPMQMIAAYDAIANGGTLRAPHIVASIGGRPVPLPRGRQILSSAVAAQLRTMLRGVFADGGTASGAAIDGWDMAGKTGTANIAVDGKYSDSEYVASFIGMVPTNDPKLLVAVVVDQPQGSIYGGSVAAPAFQKIVGWAVPYFGINPCPPGSQCHTGTIDASSP